MKCSPRLLLLAILFLEESAVADEAGRVHAESPLHARPAIKVRVGQADADIVGGDHRGLQAAVDYVGALGGGLVVIGPGVYEMRDSLHLRSRVTVRGAGEVVLQGNTIKATNQVVDERAEP
jgi:polygalacturonase